MKIASSALQFESSRSQMRYREITESMRLVNTRQPDSKSGDASLAEPIRISDAGRAAQAAENPSIGGCNEDPKNLLIRFLLARLTGKEVEVFDGSEISAAMKNRDTAPSDGISIEYSRHESYTEAEQMTFSANGVIQTADGKSIGFNLSMSMERYYHMESSVSVRMAGSRKTCDPLVINFSGNAAQLTDQRFSFDLNSDGEASEQINFLGSGSGFLAFDRNGDGRINNGSELFGTRTGNGFAELAAFDDDSNGWIDENDEAFAHLSVWIRDSAGTDVLRSLKDMGIGAISLANVSSPFSIKDENNDLLGQVQASGIYLYENGNVGSVQQVDLTV
ncbi:MAG: VCBS repeat-containing protein [Candidatus Accumulibacter sp.]|nr:VCBS repeat-containing protein [Accumulibacter sp.]